MNLDEKLSEHVTLKEAIKSNTATKLNIDNKPTAEHLENLKKLMNNLFEPLRKGMGDKPIFISCGYRSKQLNNATPGSSLTSYHCSGKALDLDAEVFGGMTNKQIFFYIKNHMNYAELIWEKGNDTEPAWVHVAFDEGKNVKETLICREISGKTKYFQFSTSGINE